MLAALQVTTDGLIRITPRDVRSDAVDLSATETAALAKAFSLVIDPGKLPFRVTPTTLQVDEDGKLELSGQVKDLVVGEGERSRERAGLIAVSVAGVVTVGVVVLVVGVVGVLLRRRSGRLRTPSTPRAGVDGWALAGVRPEADDRVLLLQLSSPVCAPCRTTAGVLADLASDDPACGTSRWTSPTGSTSRARWAC